MESRKNLTDQRAAVEDPVQERETESARKEVAATGQEAETERGSIARGAEKEIAIMRLSPVLHPLDLTGTEIATETGTGRESTVADVTRLTFTWFMSGCVKPILLM